MILEQNQILIGCGATIALPTLDASHLAGVAAWNGVPIIDQYDVYK